MQAQTIQRVALWGCGKRGANHVAAALGIEGLDLVAVADEYGDAAERFIQEKGNGRFGGMPVYTDGRAMLAEQRPDLVLMALRPVDREATIRACVEAGVRAVFCEKPVATSWGAARRIGELAERSGLRLGFCHQRRYLATFVEAKRVVASGQIGGVQLVDTRAANLFDWGTHLLDAMLFVLDQRPVTHVMGQFQREPLKLVFDQPTERSGVYHLAFADGVPGVLRTDVGFGHDAILRVVGECGVVEAWADPKQGVRVLRDGGPGRWERLEVPADAAAVATELALSDFVACVRSGRPCRIDVESALQATELIFGLLLSAVSGGRVSLPLGGLELPLAELMAGRLTEPVAAAGH